MKRGLADFKEAPSLFAGLFGSAAASNPLFAANSAFRSPLPATSPAAPSAAGRDGHAHAHVAKRKGEAPPAPKQKPQAKAEQQRAEVNDEAKNKKKRKKPKTTQPQGAAATAPARPADAGKDKDAGGPPSKKQKTFNAANHPKAAKQAPVPASKQQQPAVPAGKLEAAGQQPKKKKDKKPDQAAKAAPEHQQPVRPARTPQQQAAAAAVAAEQPEEGQQQQQQQLLGKRPHETPIVKVQGPRTTKADLVAHQKRAAAEAEAAALRRTVFVGNLPAGAGRKALHKLFSQYGEVQSVRLRSLMLKQGTGLPRAAACAAGQVDEGRASAHAYVVFAEEGSAEAALAHNMREYEGRHLRVDRGAASTRPGAPAAGRGKRADVRYDPGRSLFLGNLDLQIEDEDVVRFAAGALPGVPPGDVVEAVRVVRDPKTSLGRGFAFVLFRNKAAARGGLRLEGRQLRGRPVRVTRVDATAGKAGKGGAAADWQGPSGRKKRLSSVPRPVEGKRKSAGKRPAVAARKARAGTPAGGRGAAPSERTRSSTPGGRAQASAPGGPPGMQCGGGGAPGSGAAPSARGGGRPSAAPKTAPRLGPRKAIDKKKVQESRNGGRPAKGGAPPSKAAAPSKASAQKKDGKAATPMKQAKPKPKPKPKPKAKAA